MNFLESIIGKPSQKNSDFIPKAEYIFKDSKYAYFLNDFKPGGDLRTLLDYHSPLPESSAINYLADILLAIESIHSLGFIHRNLCPENIWIDNQVYFDQNMDRVTLN